MSYGLCHRQEIVQICANGSLHVFKAFKERKLTLDELGYSMPMSGHKP